MATTWLLTFAATNRAGNAGRVPVRLQCHCMRATAIAKPLKPAWFGEPMLWAGFKCLEIVIKT